MWLPSKVEFAFGAPRRVDPEDINTSAWVNLTDDVKSWETTRGRTYELAEIEPGTARIVLDNANGLYSPGVNPVGSANLLPVDIATGGTSCAGNMPDGFRLGGSGTLANTTLAPAGKQASGYATQFVFQFTIAGATTNRPFALQCGPDDPTDGSGPFDIRYCNRIAPSTQYSFRVRHYLVSGTGTAMRVRVYWLDSDGAVLSSSTGSNFTPSGSISANTGSMTSPAGAQYAAFSVEYVSAPTSAQSVQLGQLVFVAGGSAPWNDFNYYPNIKPGTPVRIQVQRSDTNYVNEFYGFAEDWDYDPTTMLTTVTCVDAMSLLGEQEIGTASDEQARLTLPVVRIPLNDADATRHKFTVETMGSEDLLVTREMKPMSGAVNDGAEFIFDEPGPQEGLGSLYLDPFSATEGYVLKVSNLSDEVWEAIQGGGTTVVGWFKQKRKEHGGRDHMLFAYGLEEVRSTTNYIAHGVRIESDGQIFAFGSDNDLSDPGEYFVTSDRTYFDGEWHFVAVVNNPVSTSTLYVDYDGTNGEAKTFTGETITTEPDPGGAVPDLGTNRIVTLGGTYQAPNTGLQNFRGWLHGWAIYDRPLSADEVAALYLASAPASISSGETDASRVGRVLDFVGWPESARTIDTGLSTVVDPYPSHVSALEAVRQIGQGAGAVSFIDKEGKFVYRNRRARLNPTSALTVSEAAGTMPEDDIRVTIDPSQVFNRIIITRADSGEIIVDDTESQEDHGIRTLPLDYSPTNEDDALQAGYWHLYLYKDPMPRVSNLRFKASAASGSALWDFLANLELMEATYLDLSAFNIGVGKVFVEKVTLTYDQESLTFEGLLELSPADKHVGVFTLDDDTYGLLDENVLGW